VLGAVELAVVARGHRILSRYELAPAIRTELSRLFRLHPASIAPRHRPIVRHFAGCVGWPSRLHYALNGRRRGARPSAHRSVG
jgi:hypothetical protein